MLVATELEIKPLAEWRKLRYLSQPELARAAGVHPQTVWAWEHGQRKPGWTSARKLAQALGIEPGQIEEARR